MHGQGWLRTFKALDAAMISYPVLFGLADVARVARRRSGRELLDTAAAEGSVGWRGQKARLVGEDNLARPGTAETAIDHHPKRNRMNVNDLLAFVTMAQLGSATR